MRSAIILVSSFVFAAIASPETLHSGLQKRQFGNLPSLPQACKGSCQSLNTVLGCTDPKCFCSAKIFQDMAACLQCGLNLVGVTDSYQQILDATKGACKEFGVDLPNETLTSPTSSPTPTSPSGGGDDDTTALTSSGSSAPTGSSTSTGSSASGESTTPAGPSATDTSSNGGGNTGNIPVLGGSGGNGSALGVNVPQGFITVTFALFGFVFTIV